MAVTLYAGTSTSFMSALPSPIACNPTHEIIWSEDTGRAQSGANKAKMIGNVVAEKRTYEVKWGVITAQQMSVIRSLLPAGFFYFRVGSESASRYYRSEITAEMLPIGDDVYYKDVSVSIIEQ